MLLTLLIIGVLTVSIVQVCSSKPKQLAKVGSESTGSDSGAHSAGVQPSKSKLFQKAEKQKISDTKSNEPVIVHEFSAQQPDRNQQVDDFKMYELDATQKDEAFKKANGKGLKLGNMQGSQSVTNTKNRKKRGKLDRTQKSIRSDEVNENDDDTFQDAPSIEIKGGSSVEYESPNKSQKQRIAKKSRETTTTITKGSKECTGTKGSGETIKKSNKK